jgi:hypothetical protein
LPKKGPLFFSVLGKTLSFDIRWCKGKEKMDLASTLKVVTWIVEGANDIVEVTKYLKPELVYVSIIIFAAIIFIFLLKAWRRLLAWLSSTIIWLLKASVFAIILVLAFKILIFNQQPPPVTPSPNKFDWIPSVFLREDQP